MQKESFWRPLLSTLGMFVGLFVFFLLISMGFYRLHTYWQKIRGGAIDHGRAADFGLACFWIWTILFVGCLQYFGANNWFELRPESTEAFTSLMVRILIIVGVSAFGPAVEE